MALDNFYNNIVRLQEFNIQEATTEIINENADYIQSLLVSQLEQGLDGNDNKVTSTRRGGTFDYYADRTIQEKERYGIGLGSFTDWITNYMTGDFHQSLKLEINGTEFEFKSDVSYFDTIIARSGEIILHLSKENCELFSRNILFPQLKERFYNV